MGGVTFHSSHGIGFLSETGSSTVAILMHFEQHVRNQKYYTSVGEGRKVDVLLIGTTGKGNARTWQPHRRSGLATLPSVGAVP